MRAKSLFFRSVSTMILAFAITQSWAGPTDLVELTGHVGFSSTTGSGGFEGDLQYGDDVEGGSFRLIYDPIIPDSDNSAERGVFRGAIKSFEMTVNQNYRPDLLFTLVGRGDITREFLDTTDMDSVLWLMTLREENSAVEPSMFSFHLYLYGRANANVIPGIDYWPNATAYGAGTAGVHETDWLQGSISTRTVPRPVPAPPTLWLLLIGGAAALFPLVRPWKR